MPNKVLQILALVAISFMFSAGAAFSSDDDTSPFLPDDKFLLYGDPYTNQRVIACYKWAQSCRADNCMDPLPAGGAGDGLSGNLAGNRKKAKPLQETVKCMNEKCKPGYDNCFKGIDFAPLKKY